MNEYFEEINKDLVLVPANQSKEKIKRYEEIWNKIGDLIGSVTKNSDDYDEKHMKIKFDLDDDLSLKNNRNSECDRAVFHKNNKN